MSKGIIAFIIIINPDLFSFRQGYYKWLWKSDLTYIFEKLGGLHFDINYSVSLDGTIQLFDETFTFCECLHNSFRLRAHKDHSNTHVPRVVSQILLLGSQHNGLLQPSHAQVHEYTSIRTILDLPLSFLSIYLVFILAYQAPEMPQRTEAV